MASHFLWLQHIWVLKISCSHLKQTKGGVASPDSTDTNKQEVIWCTTMIRPTVQTQKTALRVRHRRGPQVAAHLAAT